MTTGARASPVLPLRLLYSPGELSSPGEHDVPITDSLSPRRTPVEKEEHDDDWDFLTTELATLDHAGLLVHPRTVESARARG